MAEVAIGKQSWRGLKGAVFTELEVWNVGRALGAKRALKLKQIWGICFYFNHGRRLRDRALFDLAIESKIRGCDVVQMKIDHIVSGGQIRAWPLVTQQKQALVQAASRRAPACCLGSKGQAGGWITMFFPAGRTKSNHLGTRQNARLVDEWAPV